MTTAPALTDDLGVWARRSLAPAALTELDVWDAFERRDRLARLLAAAPPVSAQIEAVLTAADDAWHAVRAQVAPLLALGSYLSSRPLDHYVRQYLAEDA